MSTFVDDAMERGPLTHDAVVVSGNEWSVVSPTTLSGSVFKTAAVVLRPEHAAVIYGLPVSSYAPDSSSSLLGVSSLFGNGAGTSAVRTKCSKCECMAVVGRAPCVFG
ncbi:hypothetical protein MSAN_00158500 [Mycena sanguinolenta]|uniref:Uncharacterized protein n=1 Tax=Mycena sanguinolenta TaxID=230812 RepID=A0A8H6ZI80_9AGAR|nr:hypothetical protein MSAN_00158500 [Mycena sanguinolenta]